MNPALLEVDCAVCGGGPAGLAAAHAILRARPGTRVAVLERSHLRPRGAYFFIQPNGVRALEAISPELKETLVRHHLDHQVTRRYSAAGELLHSGDAGEVTAALRQHGELISLPWHVLQRELAAALPPGVLHTRHRFLRYREDTDGVAAEFETDEGGVCTVAAAVLVGCDGGQSGVRAQLFGEGPPQFLGTAIWRAMRPVPGDWPVENGWCSWKGGVPGQATVMTATLRDGQLAWQAFQRWPAEQLHVIGGGRRAYIQDSEAAEQSSVGGSNEQAAPAVRLQRAMASVEGHPQVVKDLIAGTDPASLTEHGQFCRDPEDCQVYAHGRVCLLGDAAHLGTPLLSQGVSLALEDALELGRAVGQHGPTAQALQAYQAARLPLSGDVHAASVQLFKEMVAGTLTAPLNEIDVCIQRGYAARTFAPLVPPAGVRAAAAAQ